MWYVGDSIKYVINNLLYTKKLEAEEYGSKGPEKQFEKLVAKATALDTLEKILKNMTDEERNGYSAGIVADKVLCIIEEVRRQCE